VKVVLRRETITLVELHDDHAVLVAAVNVERLASPRIELVKSGVRVP
jgi:hypothetical protein